jgi:NhaP-type Na+/H+ or K+/H+ antiporter
VEQILLVLAIVILAYSLFSALVPRTILTAPMLFVAAGVVLGDLAAVSIETDAGVLLEVIAELTLVLLLFTDASRIDVRSLRRELGFPIRLLGIGLPMTILLGTLVGKWLFPAFSWWEAALLSSILAPTDAALGQAVVSSPLVPSRIRQALNVESGLNDGIAVPFVMLFASLAAIHPEAASGSHWLVFWLKQVMLGPLAGVVVGQIGGRLIEAAADRGWVTESFMKLSGIAFAILAWAGAGAIGGNGFIAAFVCGMTIGVSTMVVKSSIQEFGETEGQMLSLAAFLLFGATLVLPTLRDATAIDWGYAVLSLTLIRMLPVAIALAGSRVNTSTVAFLGWFGPRGLASLIFALLVVREHEFPHERQLLTIAMLTATLSIVLHGASAVPGAKWYARIINSSKCREGCEHEAVTEYALRHRQQTMSMPDEEQV